LWRVETPGDALDFFEAWGEVPLPPYIHRTADAMDRERYQSIFAREKGAVAAPTASLHFDARLVEKLEAMGVGRAFVTLHVGAGTFQPLRTDDLDAHRMHAERVSVSRATWDAVARTRVAGGRVVAVGTTVVRALESAALQVGDVGARAGASSARGALDSAHLVRGEAADRAAATMGSAAAESDGARVKSGGAYSASSGADDASGSERAQNPGVRSPAEVSARDVEVRAAAGGARIERSGVVWSGETRLFIRPGFEFKAVDAMVTNFHLPESTLLMLVSAFAGRENVLAAYAHAVRERYRFFSYGDAMFVTPQKPRETVTGMTTP